MYSVNSNDRSETISESFHVGMNCFVWDAEEKCLHGRVIICTCTALDIGSRE